ncbi:ankyrin [Lentithecium fluviatile CBS 122367]|uniref:Ankyrin n=1 Tax=Lentithecium fluviatile CBS 122367 TaxID=1168545 RepID=A0A6G1JKR6_9PLEO|nr:ankyrin [Lentithecium fluviatile CBS 122367]
MSKHGVDLEQRGKYSGRSPLFYLFARCPNPLEPRFIRHLASLQNFNARRLRDNEGETPLYALISDAWRSLRTNNERNDCVMSIYRLAIHFDFDVNVVPHSGPDSGRSILSKICSSPPTSEGHSPHLLTLCRIVIALGVDVHARDQQGRTALHFAAFGAMHSVAKYLVKEHKARVDVVDEDGNTPLHLAARGWSGVDPRHRRRCVRFLLEEGASTIVVNKLRKKPAQCFPRFPQPTRHHDAELRGELISMMEDAEQSELRQIER